MRKTYAGAFLLTTGLALGACNSAEEATPDPIATVRVAPATTRDVEDRIVAYGSVELAAARSETLSVQSESQVAELYVIQGAAVHKGDRLLRLIASANSRLETEKAERDAAAAQTEAARVERLHAQGLATTSEWEAARGVAATATQLRDSLLARTGREQGVTLIAPRSGIVESLTVQPGDIVAPGTIAVRVADPAAWQVRLGIEPDQVKRLSIGQAVVLAGLSDSATTKGAIKYIDERVDAQSRLASAFVVGSELLPLSPGAAVRSEIIVATHPKAVYVPRSAVLYEDEKPFVYVVNKDKAERRDVELGFHDAAGFEIVKGVAAGESVVVLGNDELSDGMAIQLESAPGPAAT
ncbi:MAG: efflux RND transporter periplasmic adaptor subunit [Steroidobacterales bacterium]